MSRSEFEQRWRRRFTERGATLDDDAGIAGWTPTGLETRVRQFRTLWDAERRPAGVWLDIGCGAGTYTRLLHEQGHRVVGMDYAVTSLHKAKARSDGDPGGLDWVSADILQLPVADGQADGVLCFGVMQALSAPDQALAELSRVLKPGGELWVDGLNAHCAPTLVSEWRRRRHRRPAHLRYDAPAAFRSAAERAGLGTIRMHWLPIAPGRLRRLQGVLESPAVRATLQGVGPLGALMSHSFILRARR
ncbi:class I SAM-dependent methyltransferase [Aquisalimonas asiatica]|uniref:Methyltransferase domain-containing protein n=1 Tax=Aquisalimonas asiatica TaxID=406100 RepID=A0A1H8U4T8_9GAMM|nr:class I SAM-dependent methyltransferase [Aquisalimonas asiatica]SEO98302.1 Methyltransferase domain-containing protein [Aquisalimonas asiatica]